MLQNQKQQQQEQERGLMVEDEGVGLGMMGLLSTNPNSNSLASFLPHMHVEFDSDLYINYPCCNINNPKPSRHPPLLLQETSNSSSPWETMGMMDGDKEEEWGDDIEEEEKKKKKSGMYCGGVSSVEMKRRKKKKKKVKQVREPRFSFKTLSDVDVLDDGYKWRKYGQKVVKNTHHPRSYYRCTQDSCRVKKKVERLAEDPRMVITTYEGRHAHSPAVDHDHHHHPDNIANFFFF